MNTTKSVLFDVSPFLLLEASADSEAGHDGLDDECFNDYDGDDIDESCSASSYETSCVTWTRQRPNGLGFEAEDTVKEEREAGVEEEDDGEGEVNSYRRCQRENLAVEMSEIDKSRMFWEACLAS